jgi:tetratricopeptide (TPR) repeat protein
VGASRVDLLNAANAAFARGDTTTAAGLYERVLNTPPTPGEAAAETAAINQLASFRDLVALLALGREDEARAQIEALQHSAPDAPMTRLAAQLWDQYGMVGQLRGACAQLQPQLATQAAPTLAALQTVGVSVDPQTLCTPGGGG